MLALFSFVGFESATTLGSEARNPLKTIPRAVIQSALLAGAIFIVCAYTEVLGLRAVGQDLGASQAPMRVLAKVGGVPLFGLLIDIGVLVSMFAGTLACITAAARVLLLMSHNGLTHGSLRATHVRNETPSRAIVVTGVAAVLPVAVLAARGASGLDVYGWMGSLATYGFIVAYALVCVALPRYLRSHNAYRPAGADYSLAGVHGDAAGAGRQSLSGPRRAVRKAAVYLSGVPVRGVALVLPAQAWQPVDGCLKLDCPGASWMRRTVRFPPTWTLVFPLTSQLGRPFSTRIVFHRKKKNKSAKVKKFIAITTKLE